MKNLNLTDNGGYPMAQDDFNWLQTAYTEAIEAIVQAAGNGPYALYGAVVTRVLSAGTVYNYSISAGWIVYGGVPYRVPAMGPVAIDESVDIAQLVITTTSLPLTFNNTVVNDVINDATVGIGAAAIGTADSGTAFGWSELVTYYQALCKIGRDAAATHIVVATAGGAGTCTGDIYYRRNYINNTVSVSGLGKITTPTDCPAVPIVLRVNVGALPYAPSNACTYAVYCAAKNIGGVYNNLMKDGAGGYRNNLNGGINSGGNIYIDFVACDVTITDYLWSFNVIIPLD